MSRGETKQVRNLVHLMLSFRRKRYPWKSWNHPLLFPSLPLPYLPVLLESCQTTGGGIRP